MTLHKTVFFPLEVETTTINCDDLEQSLEFTTQKVNFLYFPLHGTQFFHKLAMIFLIFAFVFSLNTLRSHCKIGCKTGLLQTTG